MWMWINDISIYPICPIYESSELEEKDGWKDKLGTVTQQFKKMHSLKSHNLWMNKIRCGLEID